MYMQNKILPLNLVRDISRIYLSLIIVHTFIRNTQRHEISVSSYIVIKRTYNTG